MVLRSAAATDRPFVQAPTHPRAHQYALTTPLPPTVHSLHRLLYVGGEDTTPRTRRARHCCFTRDSVVEEPRPQGDLRGPEEKLRNALSGTSFSQIVFFLFCAILIPYGTLCKKWLVHSVILKANVSLTNLTGLPWRLPLASSLTNLRCKKTGGHRNDRLASVSETAAATPSRSTCVSSTCVGGRRPDVERRARPGLRGARAAGAAGPGRGPETGCPSCPAVRAAGLPSDVRAPRSASCPSPSRIPRRSPSCRPTIRRRCAS